MLEHPPISAVERALGQRVARVCTRKGTAAEFSGLLDLRSGYPMIFRPVRLAEDVKHT